jgi:hypothetical protein
MRPHRSRRLNLFATACISCLAIGVGCGKETEIEGGAVLLELSVADGVSTPDELRISVYDDTGSLWKDERVPGNGALMPESATRLGSVLIQPGATRGGLRVHVRGFAAAARVADGTLAIPGPTRGRFSLRLEATAPGDGDGDDVPDAIDDCPAVANPAQGGCPGTPMDGGAEDGAQDGAQDAQDGATEDDAGGGMDASGCQEDGGCDRPVGSACADGIQCRSSFCVDGVCCANACTGPCRSCNQPNNDGTCLPYAQGTNPAGECTGSMTCNGAGACGPPVGGPKANGELCGAGSECMSTFCADGVCCNEACAGACRTCGTGTCVNVTRRPDPPECYGTMTCNAAAKCVAS